MVVSGPIRRAAGALFAAGLALLLAYAAAGRGCARGDLTPAGAASELVAATRAADKQAVWRLLGPRSRARLTEAAQAATEKVGGARRYEPLDLLELAVPATTYAPTDVIARDVVGDHGFVDVLGPDGRRDVLEVVRVDGRWRVEMPF